MLHAERLTCIVDDRPLFAALTLSLAAGELLQVAGDNGAGKTSLLRILCGPGAPGKRGGELAGPAAGEGPGVISPSAAVAGP